MFEDCVIDIDAWMEFLKLKGYTDIHLQGHSLGCSKIAYYQKIKKNKFVKSLIFLSPSDMMGLLVEPNYKEEYERHLKEAKELISKGKGNELLSSIQWEFAKQCANSYVNFSFENDNLAIFNYYNLERGFETIKSIKIPMLAFTGTKDDAIVTNHKESMELLKKNAINCPNFEYKVFDNAEHSFDGFGNQITKEVLSFLHKP
jgi:pimeloyl-ACP methyl ester carboxylesterase